MRRADRHTICTATGAPEQPTARHLNDSAPAANASSCTPTSNDRVEGFMTPGSDGSSLQLVNSLMNPPMGTGKMFGPFAAVPGKQVGTSIRLHVVLIRVMLPRFQDFQGLFTFLEDISLKGFKRNRPTVVIHHCGTTGHKDTLTSTVGVCTWHTLDSHCRLTREHAS